MEIKKKKKIQLEGGGMWLIHIPYI